MICVCVCLSWVTENVAEEMAFFTSISSVTAVTWEFIKHVFFLAMYIQRFFFFVENYTHTLF